MVPVLSISILSFITMPSSMSQGWWCRTLAKSQRRFALTPLAELAPDLQHPAAAANHTSNCWMPAPIHYLYPASTDHYFYFSTYCHRAFFVQAIALLWRFIPRSIISLPSRAISEQAKQPLAHLLAKKYDARLILEAFADNPFLSKF